MTVSKTIKLKKVPTAEPETTETAAPAAETAAAPAAAAPAGLESPSAAKQGVAAKSYLVYALMAIAVTLFCAAILGMQTAEWMSYKADPSVWPVK